MQADASPISRNVMRTSLAVPGGISYSFTVILSSYVVLWSSRLSRHMILELAAWGCSYLAADARESLRRNDWERQRQHLSDVTIELCSELCKLELRPRLQGAVC